MVRTSYRPLTLDLEPRSGLVRSVSGREGTNNGQQRFCSSLVPDARVPLTARIGKVRKQSCLRLTIDYLVPRSSVKRSNERGLAINVPPRYRLLLILITLTLLGSVLASAFEEVDVGPLGGDSAPDDDVIISRTGRWSGNGPLLVESVLIGSGPIFEVQGRMGTSYLRTNAYTTYENGEWSMDEMYVPYQGGYLNGTEESVHAEEVAIDPYQVISGQLVSVQRTTRLQGDDLKDVEHSPELDVFRTSVPTDGIYIVTYDREEPSVSELRAKGVRTDDVHTQIPSELETKIKDLTTFIVQGIETPYDKVQALISFLKEHYRYTPFYSETPTGVDKVEWFLFNSKTGMCTHFNSALALMSRSIGIPARICSGYLVQQDVERQNITSLQAHAYVEVRFEDDMWSIFDATPESRSYEDTGGPSLTGRMFYDKDGDNVFDDQDAGLDHWNVMLMDQLGLPIRMETTSTYGFYSFHLPPGDYIVKGFALEGYVNATPSMVVVHIGDFPISLDFGFSYVGPSLGILDTFTDITGDLTEVSKGRAFHVRGGVSASAGTLDAQRVLILLAEDISSPTSSLCGEAVVEGGVFDTTCITSQDLPVGEYWLMARFLGDDTFTPSESDIPITVKDDTTISVSGEAPLIAELGGSISISLTENMGGAGVPNASLSIEAERALMLTTDSKGRATLTIEPGLPRVILLNVRYDGDAYRRNSSFISPFQVHQLQIDILSGDLVRNTMGAIVGRAYAGDSVPSPSNEIGVWDTTENWGQRIFTTNNTVGHDGLFTIETRIGLYTYLGPHNLSLSVGPLTSFMTFSVNVTAKPVIDASVSGNKVDLTLMDDLGEPLAGRSLSLVTPYSTTVVITDQDGRASAEVRAREDCNCTIYFEADSYYATATAEVPIDGSDTSLVWLALLPAAIIPLLYLATRRQRPRSETGPIPERPPSGPYGVRSPQIGPGLPLVWEGGRRLDIVVEGGTEKVDLIIDGKARPVAPGEEVGIVLPYGEHNVEVIGSQGHNVFLLRMVTYRTEIARLYIDRIVELRSRYPRITPDMAPREVLGLLGPQWPGHGSLERAVDLFERAQYSEHGIRRDDYERMFRTTKGVEN